MKITRTLMITRGTPAFIQLNSDTARILRKELYDEANGICPVLKMAVPFDKTVLDHKHKRKADPIGPNGDGLVRGLLDYRVNSMEGIVLKKFKKSGLYGIIDFRDLLYALADYLKQPLCPQIYIYPSEKPKASIMTKPMYNQIVKYWKKMFPRSRKGCPPYPPKWIKVKKDKDGNIKRKYNAKLTTKWARFLDEAQLLKSKGVKP